MLHERDHEFLQARVLACIETCHDIVDQRLLDSLLIGAGGAVDYSPGVVSGRDGVDVCRAYSGSPSHAAVSNAVRFSSVTGVGLSPGIASRMGRTALAMPSADIP